MVQDRTLQWLTFVLRQNSAWSQTFHPSASASWVQGLQVCDLTSGFEPISFLKLFSLGHRLCRCAFGSPTVGFWRQDHVSSLHLSQMPSRLLPTMRWKQWLQLALGSYKDGTPSSWCIVGTKETPTDENGPCYSYPCSRGVHFTLEERFAFLR